MEVIYGLIPGMLILGLVAVGVLFWAARSGQFEDLDGDAHRILMDDEETSHAGRLPDADPGEDSTPD
jgi:cbb3-type cytochrome oxidase maturation protein